MPDYRLTPHETQFLARLFSGDVVPSDNTTQQIVRRLRDKFGEGIVETRYGEGYIIGKDESFSFNHEQGILRQGKEF